MAFRRTLRWHVICTRGKVHAVPMGFTLRYLIPDSPHSGAGHAHGGHAGSLGQGSHGGRLNLLLADSGWRTPSFADQLPPLLAPMGVHCLLARTAREATLIAERALAARERIHIAVIDVETPVDESKSGRAQAGGPLVLELLRRMAAPPATVVVRPRSPVMRDASRSLNDALRQGAFAVLDQPCPLESMLEVLRRVLARQHGGHWPVA